MKSADRLTRVDKGMRKKSEKESEAKFLRDRQRSVGQGVDTADVATDVSASASDPWTPSHQKELEFQHQKLLKRIAVIM